MSGYPGISLLLLGKLAREHGVDVHELSAASESLIVPWPQALSIMDDVHDALDDAQREAVVREFVTSHPLIRAVAPLTAGLNAWLSLFWSLSRGVTGPDEFLYEQSSAHHEIRVSMARIGPGHGFLQFTRLAAKYVPLAVGGPPLKELEWRCTPLKMEARFEAPIDISSAERADKASGIPISAIFSALELLGPMAPDAIRDGTLAFPGRQEAFDEVARLSTDWKLTPTEARVTLSLAEGRSPKAVADELNITVGTVRVHLKQVYAKTETAGQRELVSRVSSWRLQ